MKKFYLLLIGLVSFIGISTVKADTLSTYTWNDAFDSTYSIDYLYSYYNSHINIFDNLVDYYNANLSMNYRYYYLYFTTSEVCLNASNDNLVYSHYDNSKFEFYVSGGGKVYCYNGTDYVLHDWNDYPYLIVNTSAYGIVLLYTNESFIYAGSTYPQDSDSSYHYVETLVFPSYSSNNIDIPSFSITANNPFPTVLSLFGDTYNPNLILGYQEIDLNDYSYIALSLKNYTQDPFSTNIFTKGQLCITPVYDYGMKEKTDYYSGYQVQGCTSYYNDFTSVKTYILDQDLSHHAIYYIKAYDTSKENKIKIDTSVFNISYITSENADNPIININGRNYTTIPYSELSSTSTQSEEEGYISGESVNFFDSISNSSSDLFSNPLKVLKGVWGAIVSFLTLIATFIALLPPTMQAFLYMAFSIAIILGIIKIIL